MKNIKEDIFLKRFPSLDIHGEHEGEADFIIKDFINDNYKLKQETIVIIHGKGLGILKKKTHEILKKDKRVVNYHLAPYNPGMTVIMLIIDK